MKRNSFWAIALLIFSVLFLSSCANNDDVVSNSDQIISENQIPRSKAQQAIFNRLQSDTPITDNEFFTLLSGRTIVDQIQMSDYAKREILFHDMNQSDDFVREMHPYYNKNMIEGLEHQGEIFYSNPDDRNHRRAWMSKDYGSVKTSYKSTSLMATLPYTTKVLTGVPHVFEWDATNNPNHYNWCGHGNLKAVGTFHGTTKSMSALHNTFLGNSSAGYGNGRCTGTPNKYCASIVDLDYAARLSQNGGYGWSNSSVVQNKTTIATWFQQLKDGVDFNKPCIVPSYYNCSYGHFYTIMGYKYYLNTNGTVNYNSSTVVLMDTTMQNGYFGGDLEVSVQTFFNNRNSTNILVVRPGKIMV